MDPRTYLTGIHHVTATVDDAQEDLDFYTGLLGLRLVKQTVNFDNNKVYHFYYGSGKGAPGSIMTTFPYKGQGVRRGASGSGQIALTAFSVPVSSLGYWQERLTRAGVEVSRAERFGLSGLRFRDPSGLRLELTATAADTRPPWAQAGVDPAMAIRGLHSVTLDIAEAADTIEFLIQGLGFQLVGREGAYTRLALQEGQAGQLVDIKSEPDQMRGLNGIGTVHHVAWRIPDDEKLNAMRRYLMEQYQLKVTDVKDRTYFHSIYFRIPGGVLFEIATIPPGFEVDETDRELGQHLKLPSWEEPNRARIEAALPRLSFQATN